MKPLEVHGDLVLEMGQHEIVVAAKRDRITLELSHWRIGVQLWRHRAALTQHISALEQIQDALSNAALTCDICLAGRVVARLGANARPNLSARLVRLKPVEFRPFMLGWACLQ